METTAAALIGVPTAIGVFPKKCALSRWSGYAERLTGSPAQAEYIFCADAISVF
jgi:hypothetical protein